MLQVMWLLKSCNYAGESKHRRPSGTHVITQLTESYVHSYCTAEGTEGRGALSLTHHECAIVQACVGYCVGEGHWHCASVAEQRCQALGQGQHKLEAGRAVQTRTRYQHQPLWNRILHTCRPLCRSCTPQPVCSCHSVSRPRCDSQACCSALDSSSRPVRTPCTCQNASVAVDAAVVHHSSAMRSSSWLSRVCAAAPTCRCTSGSASMHVYILPVHHGMVGHSDSNFFVVDEMQEQRKVCCHSRLS